ncbi:hypothetical protein [Caballeronia sp. J97]|uniref:hypothetical protein n=1 Tax=Caballeronia sp. J97 TaxID=2805429 RepID=UPI002AB0616D|nr:hypothetical protein [Caballeronia sp. J97]
MTTLPVPCGPLAVKSDSQKTVAGLREVLAGFMCMPSGRALQNDHADAFDMNTFSVPTDSAAAVFVGACARVRG